jgi:hypothetical protein
MLEMGFPPHLVEILRNLYRQQMAAVRTAGITSSWFRVKKGVRQGCVISPCLFNILAEMVMRRVLENWNGGFKIGGITINNLRYADDIVLIAETAEELQELVDRLVQEGTNYNLLLNVAKTKVMTNTAERINIKVNGTALEQVDVFQYLGANITSEGECRSDIRKRLAIATDVLAKLKPIWKNRGITITSKWRLVKALVWPVATYGCESWTLRKADEMKLTAFENNCARRVLRIPWTAKVTNVEVWERLQENSEFLNSLKVRKLRYFGHIMRQESPSIENIVITGLVPGKRSRGKPATAWIDNISEWTGLRGVQLVQATRNRVQWRVLSCRSRVQPSAPTKD